VTELIVRTGSLTAAHAMRLSQRALDVPLEADAELTVLELTSPATVLGAFQRHHGLPAAAQGAPLLRRVSGGPFVTVGDGTLHVLLALAHPAALMPCDPARIVNRHVRPLLRALTKSGALAHYFGRDWISVAHRPVGQVGFAHDSRSKRTVFEAFVALGTPFAPSGRASFMGKEPGTLESLVEGFQPARLAELVGASYAEAAGSAQIVRTPEILAAEPTHFEDPPWTASVSEIIGEVAAGVDGTGALKLGGDLLASRDALDRVAQRVASLPSADAEAIGRIVNEELRPPAVALDGVRDLGNLAKVLAEARQ